MPRILFWSPDTAMTGNTHAILAVSTLMGINHKAKCLLMQGHFNSRKIETSYTPYEELKENGVFENSDIGIGALTKIVVSNKLTPATIKNYAKPVLKDRLDVLYGINSKEIEQYQIMSHNLQFITRKASEIYDLVFIDTPKGDTNDFVRDVLSDAEIIVCTVNQDVLKLQDFFNSIEKNPLFKDKSIIYLLSDYEDKSKYNVKNIRSKYGVKNDIFVVPHNYAFAAACNDGSIIDYFYRNMNADRTDYNGAFIAEVNKVVEKIIVESKIKDF